MAKRKWKNIDPLCAPFIRLESGMKPQDLIYLWEDYHLHRLVALEYCEKLYDEYVYGRIVNE